MAVFAGPNITEENLVMYLDATNSRSYPGTGTTWFDLSGNENNCIANAVTYNNGHFVFNNDNYFSVKNPMTAFTADNNPVSLGIWLRPRGNGYAFSDNYIEWGITYNGSINFRAYGVINQSHASNTWGYAVITFIALSGSTYSMSAYYNGNFINTVTGNSGNGLNDQPFTIGADYAGNTYPNKFIGDISVVQLYQKQLSASEIRENFNALRGRYGI